MPLIYVTGISGAGKSAVCNELHRRGYEAHDTDQDENAVWVNRKTGEVTAVASAADRGRPGWLDDQEWRVVPSRVQALVGRAADRLVFLCGSTANEDEVWHLFSRVIYLAIDEPTLRDRLASRTSNDFGKTPWEMEAILSWHQVGEADYERFGAVIIDATLPLHDVVDKVLEAAADAGTRKTVRVARWVGDGAALWRVRVDLFADDDEAHRVVACIEDLRTLVTGTDGIEDQHAVAADQGLGVTDRPVVGLLFWVRADEVGQAATLAVHTARRAAEGHGVGPELYDVTVIPQDAVAMPGDPQYPQMPD